MNPYRSALKALLGIVQTIHRVRWMEFVALLLCSNASFRSTCEYTLPRLDIACTQSAKASKRTQFLL